MDAKSKFKLRFWRRAKPLENITLKEFASKRLACMWVIHEGRELKAYMRIFVFMNKPHYGIITKGEILELRPIDKTNAEQAALTRMLFLFHLNKENRYVNLKKPHRGVFIKRENGLGYILDSCESDFIPPHDFLKLMTIGLGAINALFLIWYIIEGFTK